jgi:hypothetical protein
MLRSQGGTFFKESFSIAYTKRMSVSRANRQGAYLLTQLRPSVDRILLEQPPFSMHHVIARQG